MMSKIREMTFLSVLFLILFSCVTINIYFPEGAVKEAADKIVDEVRQSDEDKKSDEKKDQDKNAEALISFSFVPSAYAQEETDVSNPTIRAIKESMKKRFPKIKIFFNGGFIGEGNDGFVKIRNEQLPLKERARLRVLVKNENKDRKNLYEEVARALDIDPSQIPRIQKIFAKSWIRKARPGWWIQNEKGRWIRKPG